MSESAPHSHIASFKRGTLHSEDTVTRILVPKPNKTFLDRNCMKGGAEFVHRLSHNEATKTEGGWMQKRVLRLLLAIVRLFCTLPLLYVRVTEGRRQFSKRRTKRVMAVSGAISIRILSSAFE